MRLKEDLSIFRLNIPCPASASLVVLLTGIEDVSCPQILPGAGGSIGVGHAVSQEEITPQIFIHFAKAGTGKTDRSYRGFVVYGVKKRGGMKMQDIRQYKPLMALLLSMLVLTALTSCATSSLSEQTTSSDTPRHAKEVMEPETARYYDFEDVPIPAEMGLKTDRSFVFQTTEFAAGLLAF
jgi:hypothetical protein